MLKNCSFKVSSPWIGLGGEGIGEGAMNQGINFVEDQLSFFDILARELCVLDLIIVHAIR